MRCGRWSAIAEAGGEGGVGEQRGDVGEQDLGGDVAAVAVGEDGEQGRVDVGLGGAVAS